MKQRLAVRMLKIPFAQTLPDFLARVPVSVHTKLIAGFLGIVLMFIVLGAVGLGALAVSDERASELVALERKISAYRRVQHNVTGQLHAIESAFLTPDEAQLDLTERRISHFAWDFDRASYLGGAEARLLTEIETDYDALMENGRYIVGLLREGRIEDARAAHLGESTRLANRLDRLTYSLVDQAESFMLESIEASNSAYRSSQITVLAVALLTTVLALGLGYTFSASLLRPLSDMRNRFDGIAHGDFSTKINVSNRDEIGDLAVSVNEMILELDRLYRELDEASRHKSDFLASMSHELRTPMTAIIGFNRIVMRRCRDLLPEKQLDNLEKVAVSAEQLLALINDILDLSKVESGRMELDVAEFELEEVLSAVAHTIESLVADKPVQLVVRLQPRAAPMHTDRVKLHQVIMNLMGNAAKFTDSGTITLTSTIAGGQAIIEVSDTGVGIEASELPRIFDEFSQASNKTTSQVAGTGLGLAISSRMVELMGGKIEVTSEPGVGSTFRVIIPVCSPLPDPVAMEAEKGMDRQEDVGSRTG